MNDKKQVKRMLVKLSNISVLILCMGIGLFFSSCQPEEAEKKEQEQRQVKVPGFKVDSAYAFIEQQIAFGPRVPGSEGHRQCRDWLIAKFKQYNAEVIAQDFQAKAYTGELLSGTNIIARYNPEVKQRVLLSAHWDTRHMAENAEDANRINEPILGADDGGSGVAVLLEIARNLTENPIPMGVDIVLFDLEDYGDSSPDSPHENSFCLGSQYWAQNLHEKPYSVKYGINLDMVGAKGAVFPKEQISLHFARPIVEKVWGVAKKMNKGDLFINRQDRGATDDHYYVNQLAGIPTIDIINLPNEQPPFGDHWHTHRDNIDIIDKRVLGSVGQVVLAVVYNESNGKL